MKTALVVILVTIVTIFTAVLAFFAVTRSVQNQVSQNSTPTPSQQTPTPTPSKDSETKPISIALVSLENETESESTFGCGDSLIIRETNITVQNNKIKEALETLFKTEGTLSSENGNTLYNSLAQSTLAIDSVNEQENSIDVYLEGELAIAGTCDNPRVEEQLKATVLENTMAENVNIFLNNQPLQEALSLQ